MFVDSELLAQDLRDCRDMIDLIIYLQKQENLEAEVRSRFTNLLLKNLAYDLDIYLNTLQFREDSIDPELINNPLQTGGLQTDTLQIVQPVQDAPNTAESDRNARMEADAIYPDTNVVNPKILKLEC